MESEKMRYAGLILALASGAFCVIGQASAQQASAQGVVTAKQLSADVANGLVMAAVEQCRKDGYRVTAVVIDRAGTVQALLRDNGAGPQTPGAARRKAFTSAGFGITSAEFASRVANPAAAGLKDIPGTIPLAGGIPVKAGNDLLAGLGVGGAPGGDKDEACAKAALDKFAAQLK
jgi:uncharacterized protein GlcG (DUF336 family)